MALLLLRVMKALLLLPEYRSAAVALFCFSAWSSRFGLSGTLRCVEPALELGSW